MSEARLQKRARLLKAAEFKRVFDRPVRSSDKYFTVLARKNDVRCPRLGLAISKRNAKHAVTRNRIKRVVRESFRQAKIVDNIDYVVMVTATGARADNPVLFQSLEKLWQALLVKCVQS
jgi:ribonuclease P protein component